jgi:hypothetical protein
MFNFFKKRWVSRVEFDELEKDYKSQFDSKHKLAIEFHKKRKELLGIIEAKEKEIQKLKLEILELKK